MTMSTEELAQRRIAAAAEFDQHENRNDGLQAASSLGSGLTILRDALYARTHYDIHSKIGMDSTISPLSEEKSEKVAKLEIELYQIAASAVTVQDRRYIAADDDWYLRWLARLRLGRVSADAELRLNYYLSKTPDERRLAFSNILTKALPESRQAPLVLFRLVPHAVQIITALSFGDRAGADEARDRQAILLPAIHDCRHCLGKVLESGDQCRFCGNPLWKFDWLTAIG